MEYLRRNVVYRAFQFTLMFREDVHCVSSIRLLRHVAVNASRMSRTIDINRPLTRMGLRVRSVTFGCAPDPISNPAGKATFEREPLTTENDLASSLIRGRCFAASWGEGKSERYEGNKASGSSIKSCRDEIHSFPFDWVESNRVKR